MTWTTLRSSARAIYLYLAVMLALSAGAQESHPISEYRVKAAFLFNFAKFVEWPATDFPTANSPFVIGVLGENPFGKELEETVRNKSVNDHPLVVKMISSSAEATNCHILFISDSEKKRLPEIIEAVHGANILTVGESDHFIQAGGIINFRVVENKIRFQINNDAAKSVHLKIDSKLLGLAVQ